MVQQIIAIFAVSENGVIGKGDDLPWNLPAEFLHFKKSTLGFPVIMGRKTYEILGKPLPGRKNIVVSRNEDYSLEQGIVVHSLDQAIALCKEEAKMFIIGGGMIYQEAFDRGLVDQVIQTIVHTEAEGDTYLKPLTAESGKWKKYKETFRGKDAKNEFDFSVQYFLKASGIKPPAKHEYAPFYQGYIAQAEKFDPIAALHEHILLNKELQLKIKAKGYDYRYAEGKWSLREMMGHIIETEIIMSYRMLRIGRGDKTPLAGMDQDVYINQFDWKTNAWENLMSQYKTTRAQTLAILHQLPASALNYIGEASGMPVSTRGLLYIIVGHERHHIDIIKKRYLTEL